MFEVGVFCLAVGMEEHLRDKYLHTAKLNDGTELVSQDIILLKTDGIVNGIHFF